jgi:hypothetical protein
MKGLTLIYGRDSSLKRSQEPMDIEVASKVRSLKLTERPDSNAIS